MSRIVVTDRLHIASREENEVFSSKSTSKELSAGRRGLGLKPMTALADSSNSLSLGTKNKNSLNSAMPFKKPSRFEKAHRIQSSTTVSELDSKSGASKKHRCLSVPGFTSSVKSHKTFDHFFSYFDIANSQPERLESALREIQTVEAPPAEITNEISFEDGIDITDDEANDVADNSEDDDKLYPEVEPMAPQKVNYGDAFTSLYDQEVVDIVPDVPSVADPEITFLECLSEINFDLQLDSDEDDNQDIFLR